ncbi:MAG: hypothetical protein ACREYA_34925 [Cupriavidus necator]
MARPHPWYCKRQGKAAVALPIAYGFRDGALLTLQLKARLALDAFRRGDSTLHDVASIEAVLLVGLLLGTDRTSAVTDAIEQARRVLLEGGSLMQQGPEVFPTDEQFVQLSHGLSYCEALLEASTRRQVWDALAKARHSATRKEVAVG